MRVLITGGNKGIGLAATKRFLQENHQVVVAARDFEGFSLPNVEQIKFDLIQLQKIPELVKKVEKIDILINNAGLMNALPYDNYPEDKLEEIIKINLKAPIALITEFSKSMVKSGKGRIVNVASIAGQIGHPDIWYGATKAGLINVTKSFARILGPKGIVINCVAPGPVQNTPMMEVIPEERKTQIKNSVISSRFAEAGEVAETIYWLATEAPEYINGFCIDINNGSFPR